jgi:hypothetical protein
MVKMVILVLYRMLFCLRPATRPLQAVIRRFGAVLIPFGYFSRIYAISCRFSLFF